MTALTISTKYRIAKRDMAATLETIKKIGYDEALKFAFNGSLSLIEKDPGAPIATTYLAWSVNLLGDSRSAKADSDREKCLQLSGFYRTLAHRIYWSQRAAGTIEIIQDFMQLALVKK